MPRLGHYTGTIYPDDYDFTNCSECCLILKEGQAEDKEYIQQIRVMQQIACLGCMSCPAAQAGKENTNNEQQATRLRNHHTVLLLQLFD